MALPRTPGRTDPVAARGRPVRFAPGRTGKADGQARPDARPQHNGPAENRWRGGARVGIIGGVLIKDATPRDWAAIWPFFRKIVAAGETYTYPRDLDEETGRALWMLQPPGRTVVATDEHGAVLGSARMNPNHLGGASHIAGAAFMVVPEQQGRGVGRALGEHVLGWARAEGYRAMQFNAVVETNTAAVALWRSLGFEVMTTLPEGFLHPTHGYVGLHIMYQLL